MVRLGHYDLSTEAGEALSPEEMNVWQEYPRPQMRRAEWMSLNGNWKLNDGDIRVPFAPQAKASGYSGKVKSHLIYEKNFVISRGELSGERFLLHFGAADQIAEVFLNGRRLGNHEGGYLAFSFDVTDVIDREGENTLW